MVREHADDRSQTDLLAGRNRELRNALYVEPECALASNYLAFSGDDEALLRPSGAPSHREPRHGNPVRNAAARRARGGGRGVAEAAGHTEPNVGRSGRTSRGGEGGASLAQEGAAARRGGRKKVEDVDAAAVAIQRTLRGKRGRARARASKG